MIEKERHLYVAAELAAEQRAAAERGNDDELRKLRDTALGLMNENATARLEDEGAMANTCVHQDREVGSHLRGLAHWIRMRSLHGLRRWYFLCIELRAAADKLSSGFAFWLMASTAQGLRKLRMHAAAKREQSQLDAYVTASMGMALPT